MSIIPISVIVVMIAVVVVQQVLYVKLSKQSKISAASLAEKEELIKKEAMISAKEALQDEREKFNEEERERRRELNNYENKLTKREDELENKIQSVTDKESNLDKREDEIDEKESYLEETIRKQVSELERISGLSVDDAKKMLLEQLKKDLAQEQMQLIRENEAKIREDAQEKASRLSTQWANREMINSLKDNKVTIENNYNSKLNEIEQIHNQNINNIQNQK